MLTFVREGDTLIVTRLDRLARSTAEALRFENGRDQRLVAELVFTQQRGAYRVGEVPASFAGRVEHQRPGAVLR